MSLKEEKRERKEVGTRVESDRDSFLARGSTVVTGPPGQAASAWSSIASKQSTDGLSVEVWSRWLAGR